MDTDKRPIYPIQVWDITETEFDIKNNYRNETTFALSNGYIGTRGTFEEAYDFDIDTGLEGNFVNGFYESEKIRYGEANFGSPLLSQSLLNLPNLKETHVILADEKFDMMDGTVEEYERVLHMKEGILERKLIWTSPKGKKTRIQILRLVSFARKNIMLISYRVTPLNYSGEIQFVSKMQTDVENHTRKTNPIVDYGPFGRRLDPDKMWAKNNKMYYEGTTKGSQLTMACGSSHVLWKNNDLIKELSWQKDIKEMMAEISVSVECEQGTTVKLDKFICYSTALDMGKNELETFVNKELEAAETDGGLYLEKYQKWSLYEPEVNGVMIAYASVYGNTENAANILACRLRDKGIKTTMFDVSVAETSEVVAASFQYSHLVFAAPTYNGGIFIKMDEVLRDIEAHSLKNRTVAFMENGTWAVTCGKQMKEIFAGLKGMNLIEDTVTIKSALADGQEAQVEKLAEAIAETM